MGFKKVDAAAQLNNAIKRDPKLEQYVKESNAEYELIKSLVELRKQLGLTQKDVATKSGLTQQMISRIEKIDHTPSLKNFLRYVSALNVTLNPTKN